MIGARKAALNGKTKLVGSVDGGWPKAAHIAVTLKKGSGPGRTGSNRAERRDQERRLRQGAEPLGEGVERISSSEVNPAGLGD